jgi:hypothetical protein
VTDPYALPAEAEESMNQWIDFLSAHWKQEVPVKIHVRQLDAGGAPDWTPEFERWLDRGPEEGGKYDSGAPRRKPKNPELRLRATRAFRKLRKQNIREFEVLYRTVVLGHSIEDTSQWLTARAIRNEKPERYSYGATQILLFSAAHKVMTWL